MHLKVLLIILYSRMVVNSDAINLSGTPKVRNVQDGEDPVPEEEYPVCGTVASSEGEVLVTLREGDTLSPEEFERVYSGKLKNATIAPFVNKTCVIMICGFKSWGPPTQEGFIGSDCDYADCVIFERIEQAPPDIFDEGYNTSSISCGCQRRSIDECYYNCHKRAHDEINNWGDKGCAILYQELACNACYFEPITLSIGQNYSTDNSHHIRSMLIRDKCTVKQYIPALKRMWRFANMSQPIIHFNYYPIESTMNTSFINEPESFYCTCEDAPPPTPRPPTRRPPTTPTPPQPIPDNGPVTIFIVTGGISIAVIIVTTSVVIWRIRRLRPANNFTRLEEDDDNPEEVPDVPSGDGDTPVTISVNNDTTTVAQLTDDLVDKIAARIFPWIQEHSRMQFPTTRDLTTTTTTDTDTRDNDDKSLLLQLHRACGGNKRYIISYREIRTVGQNLGSGNFGTVRRGRYKLKDVAIKKMTPCSPHQRPSQIESFIREIETFVSIGDGHENIVKFFGACLYRSGKKLCILTEFCNGGTLQNFLQNLKSAYIDATNTVTKLLTTEDFLEFMRICKEIANGLVYLHGKGIIHVDLATRNILLFLTDSRSTVKICDFGLSRKCIEKKDYARSLQDGLHYHSIVPEALTKEGYTGSPIKVFRQIDIWAYACTIWEIFSMGDPVYSHFEEKQFLHKFNKMIKLLSSEHHDKECECHPKPKLAPSFVYAKLLECWNPRPENRPNFQTLQSFFEQIEHEHVTYHSVYLAEN